MRPWYIVLIPLPVYLPKAKVRLPSSGPLREKYGAEQQYYYPAYEEIQKLHKRLRKAGWKFSFLCCEEVGDLGRLHFHVIYIFKNPDIIPDWSVSDWVKYQRMYLKTRQDKLDFHYDVNAENISFQKVDGKFNRSEPPSNWLKVLRFQLRYMYWRKGKVTVTVSQHIGGVVHYLTTYALEYASNYAKEKNLPPPVWRSSRLGSDWYENKKYLIKRGDLRTLSLGNGFSISMPKYRLSKYRDPFDRLTDYIKSMSAVFADKGSHCKTHLFPDIVERNRRSLYGAFDSAYNRVDMPDFDDIPLDVFYEHYTDSINTILNSKHYD